MATLSNPAALEPAASTSARTDAGSIRCSDWVALVPVTARASLRRCSMPIDLAECFGTVAP